MRKIALLAAFAVVTSAAAVHAQDAGGRGMGRGPGGRGGPGGPAMMLLKGITLTDAQKASLQDIQKAEREKMQADGGQGRGDFDAIRDARQKGDTATANRLMAEQRATMDARRAQQTQSIRAILTNDQIAQFDANVAEMKKRESEAGPRGQGGGRRGGRPPQ